MPTRQICLVLACIGCALAAPAAASADSVLFVKGGQVWITNTDGSSPRQFTLHEDGWQWPSMADDGTVVIAGGPARSWGDGSSDAGSSRVYRFSGAGNQIGSYTPTYGTHSTAACPSTGPSSVRVSPDGTKIAYSIGDCNTGRPAALWTPVGSTTLDFPHQTSGQDDFWDPTWIDNDHFGMSAAEVVVSGAAQWGEHLDTADDNTGAYWSESAMPTRLAHAVIARSGKEAVVFFYDATHLDVWVYYDDSMPSDFSATWPAPADACKFTTIARASISDMSKLSPSLSPDGTKLMWADDAGVKLMSLGDPTNDCDGHGSAPVAFPNGAGGSEPFYAKGNLQAGAPSPVQPDPAVELAAQQTTTTTATPAQQSPAAQNTPTPATVTPGTLFAKFALKTKHARARKKVTFDAGKSSEAGGRLVSYRWSFGDHKTGKGRRVTHKFKKPGRYTVKLTVTDATGRTATVKHKIRVK